MRIIDKIKNWHRGIYIPPQKNYQNDGIFILSTGHYEQPLLAKIITVIGAWFVLEYKWIIGIALLIYINLFFKC